MTRSIPFCSALALLFLLVAVAPARAQDAALHDHAHAEWTGEVINETVFPCVLVIDEETGGAKSVTLDALSDEQRSLLLASAASMEGPAKSAQTVTTTTSGAANATITVNYTDFSNEARNAFQRAVDTWSEHIDSEIEIQINANYTNLGQGTLGSAGPTGFYGIATDIDNPAGGPVFYAHPLADAITGNDLGGDNVEINANFNQNANWYFGAAPNGATPGQTDFTTVVLHEIGHGLGFLGLMNYDNNTGEGSYQGASSYDVFARDADGNQIIDTDIYPNPSTELGEVLTSDDNIFNNPSIFFTGERAREGAPVNGENGSDAPPLFTPANWNAGSSYSHLDESTYPPSSPNALMTPFIGPQQSARLPGGIMCGMFADIGWPLAEACLTSIPVELAGDFSGRASADGTVTLTWTTRTESGNDRFVLSQRRADGSFAEIGTEPSQAPGGTSAEAIGYRHRVEDVAPGSHVFRLVQVDLDGDEHFGAETAVEVGLSGAFALSQAYPNPFRAEGAARVDLSVSESQEVKATLHDTRGRLIRTLFSGRVEASSPEAIRVEAGALSSGVYVVRVEGEDFTQMRTVTLVR